MADWREELRPYAGEPRGGAGWRLTKAGWRLLRRDRTLAALSLLVALTVALAYATPSVGRWLGLWGHPTGSLAWDTALSGVVLLLVSFLLVAFASAVEGAVDGLPLDLREALGDARRRLGAIVAWTAIALAAWLAIRLLSAGGVLTWLATALVAVAWYFVTVFVLAAIAIERMGALAALAESRRTFARDWRAVCAATLGILAFLAAALILPFPMYVHARAVEIGGSGNDDPLVVAATALTVVVVTLALVTREAFAVLQLRAVLDDLPAGEYRGRRLRRRAKAGRVAAGIAIALLALFGASALVRSDRETLRTSREPGANYTAVAYNPSHVDLPAGAPVIYRGSKVGTVLGSHEEGGGLSVTFHLEPGIGPESAPGRFQVIDAGAFGPSLVLIPEPGGGGGGDSQAQVF